MILLTIAADALAIVLCGITAYFIRSLFPALPVFSLHVFLHVTALFSTVLICVALIVGLYRTVQHSNTDRQYFLAGKAYLVSVLILLSLMYMFRGSNIPRRFVVIYILLLPFVFTTARIYLKKFMLYMRDRGYGNHNVLLAGYDNGGIPIIKRFKSFPELGYDIKGIITSRDDQVNKPLEINNIHVQRYSLSEVDKIIAEFRIDRVFVPSAGVITDGYFHILEICKEKNIKLKVLSDYSDSLLRLSHVYDIAGIPMIAPRRRRIDTTKKVFKRIFDIIASLLVLSALSPLLLIVAICIFIEDGMPVLFYQSRALVKDKEIFNIIKFRSMNKNAELKQSEMYELNEVPGGLFKIQNDSRLTRVGKVIRKFSIDEMPQFINVLLGNMSIVGPRPLSTADLENIEEKDQMLGLYTLRSKGKPGITGLWQISGRRDIDFREMVFLDLYYLENQSLLFDLEIIFATVPVVLFGKGAY